MAEKSRVPFTILTGFLGAGKTTVLNRMLANPGGRRIAVLVNELGRVAIDGSLIVSRGGDILELAGGCVCCKVDIKNDLWDGIVDVIERSKPDHVVLETTGIAEPAAILEGLRYLPESHLERVAPAGVVCVVEAEAGPRTLKAREEAREQVLCADALLLSKLDRATPEQAQELHDALDELGADCERASFPLTDDASHALTAWVLTPRESKETRPHTHSHSQGQLIAASFVDDAPLLGGPVLRLVQEMRPQLYRVKGFVHIAGQEERGFLELAGDSIELRQGDPWGDEKPRTELVFIGDDVDEAALRRRLWACRAS
jgi:G3E family GTPase